MKKKSSKKRSSKKPSSKKSIVKKKITPKKQTKKNSLWTNKYILSLATLGLISFIALPSIVVVASHNNHVVANKDNPTYTPPIIKHYDDLERPFSSISETQTKDTIYEVASKTRTYTGNLTIDSNNFLLSNFNKDLDNINFEPLTKVNIFINGNKMELAIGEKTLSSSYFNVDGTQTNLSFEITKDGRLNVLTKEGNELNDYSFLIVTKVQVVIEGKRNYWTSNLLTKSFSVSFKLNLEECESVDNIIDQLNAQLHIILPHHLDTITPLQFADYMVDLANSNGLSEWVFKVNDVKVNEIRINPTPMLKALIKGFDGDSNPNQIDEPRYHAISNASKRTSINSNAKIMASSLIEEFPLLQVKEMHIYSLLANFSSQSIKHFIPFVRMLKLLGDKIKESPALILWAKNKDNSAREAFNDFGNEVIKRVLLLK